MLWWWIGNIVLLVAVFPVVLFLLNRILGAVESIRLTIDDIYNNAVHLHGQLQPVPDLLAETDETVREVSVGATRYVASVEKLL